MTNADIQEMEQVREHLQLMLQNCKGFTDRGDYEQTPRTTTGELCNNHINFIHMYDCLLVRKHSCPVLLCIQISPATQHNKTGLRFH